MNASKIILGITFLLCVVVIIAFAIGIVFSLFELIRNYL
jgi:hypothetical protein